MPAASAVAGPLVGAPPGELHGQARLTSEAPRRYRNDSPPAAVG
jgi:hypothetical protein